MPAPSDRFADRAAADLPIVLDRSAPTPLTAQLAAGLRDAIDRGTLRPGEPVPATRSFSSRLGIARGVVVSAYEQLIAEGYLAAGQGLGTRVHPELALLRPGGDGGNGTAADAAPPGAHEPAHPAEPAHCDDLAHAAHPAHPAHLGDAEDRAGGRAADDPAVANGEQAAASTGSSSSRADRTASPLPEPLTPGLPDTTAVDNAAWRAAWRQAVARAHLHAPALGDPQLRAGIAEHLRRMRGTARSADDVIVTSGAREGLDLLLTALIGSRGRALTVGVEDPGYPSLRRVAERHGTDIVALPVDSDGLDTSALRRELDLVIVTPSHQYPLGGSLPLTRRRQLLAWAAESGGIVVEDDYDSELRHTGSPLPALAALDDPRDGSVVLLGTFSKTVSPALSAGFLVAPARLRALIEPVRRDLGGPVPAVVQTALAQYLESGELRRHTARMRRRYAERRERVVERLLGIPGVRVRPMSGGLHAVVQLEGTDRLALADAERNAAEAAAAAGLGAVALSGYWHRRNSSDGLFGLVIGTGGPYGDVGTGSGAYDLALDRLRAILLAVPAGLQR